MNSSFFIINSLIFNLLLSTACWAQQCRNTIESSSHPGQFVALQDGTVMDTTKRLVWMRCSVGQSWDKATNSCLGNPTSLTWPQARQSADSLQRQLKENWRLPTLNELSAIAELRCVNPAIDLRWFPNTGASHYWTGTPFVNHEGYFWLLQFLTGENDTDSAKRPALVRLVRDAE